MDCNRTVSVQSCCAQSSTMQESNITSRLIIILDHTLCAAHSRQSAGSSDSCMRLPFGPASVQRKTRAPVCPDMDARIGIAARRDPVRGPIHLTKAGFRQSRVPRELTRCGTACCKSFNMSTHARWRPGAESKCALLVLLIMVVLGIIEVDSEDVSKVCVDVLQVATSSLSNNTGRLELAGDSAWRTA